jgi:hypothetical protein
MLNPQAYAYSDILSLAQSTAVSECSAPETAFGDDVYILEVALTNEMDVKNGLGAVRGFWGLVENFEKGRLVEWPMGTAGVLPPSLVPKRKWEKITQGMWSVDQIPDRVMALETVLAEGIHGVDKPIIVLMHCNAGCDRTGELVGSYRMLSSQPAADPVAMYAADIAECGRAPNYYSTHALEWACLTKVYEQGEGGGFDEAACTSFATCAPFGDCEPVDAN